jgi:hypothetical protein
MARVWITDGSLPAFSDTHLLRASHPALFGLRTRYEGFVDPAVERGSVTIGASSSDDALYVEAEWLVEFPEGIERYLQEPELLNAATPITVQGMIEGKWMNRLLGTRSWQPASLGNNLIAAGPGIRASVGALEWGEGGAARTSYRYGDGRIREQHTSLADLRGHNTEGLLRDALRTCAREGIPVDGVNLGAVGEAAAVVNERTRIRAAASPFPHRAKETLVRTVLEEDFRVPDGATVELLVVDADGSVVGEGSLTLEPFRRS